eukprot:5886236-Prymnesium_polylepis.1
MAVARELLEEVRQRLKRDEPEAGSIAADSWRAQAVALWGDRVPDAPLDWEAYVLSRRATPSPTSPVPLLQEYYSAEPWCPPPARHTHAHTTPPARARAAPA